MYLNRLVFIIQLENPLPTSPGKPEAEIMNLKCETERKILNRVDFLD